MHIIHLLKKIFHKLFFNPYKFVKNNPHISAGNSRLGKSFLVQFSTPRTGMSFVVGDDCILYNQNIFESDRGHIQIGDRVYIGGRTQLISRSRIDIGNDVMISWGCTIYDHDAHSIDYKHRIDDQAQHLQDWACGNLLKNKDWSTVRSAPIKIMDHAWIGFDVVILKGVTIGEGAIIGARSVVTSNVPAWTIAAGCPARVIKEIPHEMRKKDSADSYN